MTSGIYRILCKPTRKCYVGSAVDIRGRFVLHRSHLRARKHHSVLLQRAWDKYGEDAFTFEVLKHVEREHLLTFEQGYINLFDAANPEFGFNVSPTAGNCFGVKHSAEARANYSAAARLKPITAATRQKMNEARRGKHRSVETRARISASLTGKKQSAATVAKRIAKTKGKKRSAIVKQKMREIALARPNSHYESMRFARAKQIQERKMNGNRPL